MDGSEDLVIHCIKPNQPCVTGLEQLKGLYYIVLHERQDNSETKEGLTHTYSVLLKKPIISDSELGKIK